MRAGWVCLTEVCFCCEQRLPGASGDDGLLSMTTELLVTGDVVQDRGITVMSGLFFPRKFKEAAAPSEMGPAAGFARGSFDGTAPSRRLTA